MRRALMFAVALFALSAYAGGRHGTAPADWWYMGEAARPVAVGECPYGANVTINYSSSAYGPWKRFCATGQRRAR